MNNIGITLADTLIRKMPDANDSVERWIVIAVLSVFLLLFFIIIYNQMRTTKRNENSLQELLKINEKNTRTFEILASNVMTMLIAGQQGKIYVLNLSGGIDLFRAVLKGHCYQKVEIMVGSLSSTLDLKLMIHNVMQRFKELTSSEVQLLNKIVCEGRYLGEPLEMFMTCKWQMFEEGISVILNKYYRSRDLEAMRIESYNYMWEQVENLISEIMARYCCRKEDLNGLYSEFDSSK